MNYKKISSKEFFTSALLILPCAEVLPVPMSAMILQDTRTKNIQIPDDCIFTPKLKTCEKEQKRNIVWNQFTAVNQDAASSEVCLRLFTIITTPQSC